MIRGIVKGHARSVERLRARQGVACPDTRQGAVTRSWNEPPPARVIKGRHVREPPRGVRQLAASQAAPRCFAKAAASAADGA